MTYTKQLWADEETVGHAAAITTPYGGVNSARLNHMEQGIFDASRSRIDVEAWGADGTGVADSSAAFATILALSNENAVIYSNPNRTYKITSRLLINKASAWEFNGSVVQAAATLANDAVAVTADNVTIVGMVVDGNKASGRSAQQTIRWQADKGLAVNCEARNGTAGNWVLQTGTIELRGCRSLNAVGINFETISSGVSRLIDCYSEGSAFVGYYYHDTAADGCYMDGCRSYLDAASMSILSSNGEIGTFTGDYALNGGMNAVATGPRKYLTTAFGNANSNMSFVCGLPGDHAVPNINVVFVDPGAANRALTVAWSGTMNNWTLTITLATNGASSTNISDNSARRVINAVYAATPPSTLAVTGGSPTVNDPHLVEVTLEPGNDGTGIVGTMASTALAGGSGHTPHGWTIGTMMTRRTGYNLDGTIHTGSATAYTFEGCSDFQVNTLIAKDVQGYGISFAAAGGPRIPACRINVDAVDLSNQEALDGGDPGIAVQQGCFDITVGGGSVQSFTWGVSIGDSDVASYGAPPSGFRGLSDGTGGGGPVPARDVTIGPLRVSRCRTGVMVVNNGRRIRVAPIQATDCGTDLSHGVGAPTGYGLLSFNGTGIFTTGGSITATSTTFTLPGPVTQYYYYQKNARVKVTGIGPAGADLVTRVTALSGSTLTLADAASTTNANATIQLLDTVVDDITVESFEHLVTERLGRWQDLPINLVYCDPLATSIKVRYKALGCREAPARDDNGGNQLLAEWPQRVRQLVSADATETWTASGGGIVVADNTTAGQYSEGTGGKKLTPAAGGASGVADSPTFGPVDLSAAPDETWFRMGVFVENYTDAAVSNAIRFRLKSGATAFDESPAIIGSGIYRNGLYYLHFRKRDITGRPGGSTSRLNWAAVNQVELILNGVAGNFRVTVDDIVQLGPTFAERQQLPAIDAPSIRLGNGQTPMLEPLFVPGSGSPEGVVAAPPSSGYFDVAGGSWYRKASGFGKTGWLLLADSTFDAGQQLMGEVAYPPFDPALLPSSGAPSLGFFFATLMRVFASKTVTSLVYNMVTQGTSTTLVKVALYPTAGGSALASSADNSAAFNTAGNASTWLKTDFSSPYTPAQDGWVYGGIVVVGGTAPVLTRNLVVQLGKPRKSGGLRLCAQHTASVTDLPGTFTPVDSSHLYGPVGI